MSNRNFSHKTKRGNPHSVQTQGKARLSYEILSAIAAAGMLVNPYAALAATNITDGSGKAYTANNNGAYDIAAQKRNGSNAINKFQKFQLGQNDIANLYFHTAETPKTEAGNLINFVDTRIDINGTLNSIHNAQIGGNLYFLSPNGMAVGKTGVINTGSLYVMTPASGSAEEMTYEGLQNRFDGTLQESDAAELLANIQSGNLAIPLNPSGTITVLGTVNATNNVKMYAPRIAVGKNISGETLGDTAADGLETGAAINTGVTDFTNVVKLTAAQKTAAGLENKGLKVTAEAGSGDLVLAAKAEYENVADAEFAESGKNLGLASAPKTITASVDSYGTLNAAGSVELKAEASNGNYDEAKAEADAAVDAGTSFGDDTVIADVTSGYAKTIANVNVQGNITAAEDVTLTASANNTYVDTGDSVAGKAEEYASYVLAEGADVALLENQAAITLGSGAQVQGKHVNVTADAQTEAVIGVEAEGKKASQNISALIPSAAVNYAQVKNTAQVTVDGTLTATGADTTTTDEENKTVTNPALQVTANAASSVTNEASIKVESGEGEEGEASTGAPLMVAAVTVTNHENNANVAINGTLDSQGGSVGVSAAAENTLSSKAESEAPNESAGSTAVDVVNHNSKANVDVQGTVKGNQNVDIAAKNTLKSNSHQANNAAGEAKEREKTQLENKYGGYIEQLKEIKDFSLQDEVAGKIIDLFSSKDAKNEGTSLADTIADNITAGAAVVYADETNTAAVNLGKNSVTEAKLGNLTAKADATIEDTKLTAAGTSNTFGKDETTAKPNVASVGFVYDKLNQSAQVTVEDGGAKLTAGKDLTLQSSAEMEYNRINRMKADLEDSLAKLKFALTKLPATLSAESTAVKTAAEDLQSSLTAYQDEFDSAAANVTAEGINEESTWQKLADLSSSAADVLAKSADLLTAVKTAGSDVADDVKGLFTSASEAVDSAAAFKEPTNYANVSASAQSLGDQDTQRTLAGAITLSNIDFASSVTVGQNAVLTAADNLNLKAVEKIEDVNINGKLNASTSASDTGTSGGATGTDLGSAAAGAGAATGTAAKKTGTGVGGSFNYQNFDSSALVRVEQGAELTGGDLNLTSDSDVFHAGITLSAGKKAASNSLSGMVSVTDSDSNNQVLVDKDAKLTALKDSGGSTGTISLAGHNNTNVNNAILALASSTGSAAVGMSVAVNNIDVTNRAAIEDLDTAAAAPATAGSISAAALNVSAETTGLINTITVAGGATSSESSTTQPTNAIDNTGGNTGALSSAIPDAIGESLDSISGVSEDLTDALESAGENQGGTAGASGSAEGESTTPTAEASPLTGTAATGQTGTSGSKKSSLSLSGAGSVSVNLETNTTEALIDGANLQLNNDGDVQVGARDTAFVGAWSGGAALSLSKGNSSKKKVAVSGAAAVNRIDNNLTAAIKNSTLTGVKAMDIEALSGGTAAAAGLGLSVIKDTGTNFAGGASVSVNLIDKDVTALAEDNTVTGSASDKADLDVTAYESDLQITGGVNADLTKGGGKTVGGSVAVANINNNINAGIKGGTYTNVNTAKVESLLATKQITGAVSAGVAVGGDQTDGSSNGAFTGAFVYNGLTNKADAAITGVNLTAAGNVAVKAHDTTSGSEEAKPYQEKLGDYSKHQQFAEDAGLDTDGSSYYKDTDEEGNGLDTAGQTVDMDDTGSLSVGAALIIAGSNGNAAGAAVNVADRDIDFSARIDNATIQAGSITTASEADSLGVDVAAGIAAGSQSFGGAASVTWQTQNNDILAQVSDSTITTDKLAVTADSSAKEVNVAGSVAYGGKAGIGAAVAYNKLSNQIQAYLAGGSVTNLTETGVDLDVTAANTSKLYAIGATVAASKSAGLSGTAAINHGGSDTEAVIGEAEDADGKTVTKEKTTLTNIADTNVEATSSDTRLAVVGNVDIAGKVALGGAVAYNDVGGAGTGEAGQKTRAAMVNAALTTTDAGKASLHAADTSKLTTIGVGVGGAGKVAIQGGAATALVNKDITAEVKNSTIQAAEGGTTSDVSVTADSKSTINTVAVAAAGSGTFAGGAGVSVNRIKQATTAAITGGSQITDTDTLVQATGNNDITSAGIGAAAAGNVGIAGNVAVNQIGNDVQASVADSTLTSTGNIGVLANGREKLGNYAGALGVSAFKGGAGIGVSVSSNEITGNTAATVTGSTLQAAGKNDESIALTQTMDDTGVQTSVTKDEQVITDARKGIVTAAYGQHDLESVAVTGGIAASGSVSVGAAGTVTLNKLGGSTKAVVTNTTINETRTADANDDVTVKAIDRTNSESHVGSLSIGVGATGGAGVAGASDTLAFSRTTQAELSGNVSNPDSLQNKTVNGRNIDVTADQKSSVVTNADGLSISGGGTAAASAAATVAVTKLNGTTQAVVKNITSTNDKLNVTALHDHHTTLYSASAAASGAPVGVAIGAGIGIVNDDFTTSALVDNSTSLSSTATSVNADSTTDVDTYVIGTAASVGAAGATIGVNNINSTTTAEVNNSTIGKAGTITPDVSVDAHNKVTTNFGAATSSAGAAAIGVGVGINTVDTGTLAKVTNSTVNAKTAAVTSREELDVDQTMAGATLGGFGLNTNVMVTTIGTQVADSYGSDADKSGKVDTKSILANANNAIGSQNNNLTSGSNLISSDAGVTVSNNSGVSAKTGVTTPAAGTQTLVDNSTITTSDALTISADRQTDATLTAAAATVAGVSGANVTVATLDAKKDAGVTISGKSVLSSAKDLTVQAKQHGTTAVKAYQAALSGGLSVNAAFAQSKSSGATNVTLSDSSLLGGVGGAINEETGEAYGATILAEDTGKTTSDVVGLTVSLGAAGGALITNAENDSSTKVTINQASTIASTGATSVTANKANGISASTLGGALGAGALQGIVAYAEDKGNSAITLTGANKLGGDSISILAKGAPNVTADAEALSGALLGAVGASLATAKAGGEVSLSVGDGSTFSGKNVTLGAAAGQQTGTDDTAQANAKANAVGLSAALGGSFQANVADASQNTVVMVSVGKSSYKADTLAISGTNSSALDADAKGVTVGTIASGENISQMTGSLTTNVSASGTADGSSLGSVTLRSSGYGNLANNASGAGGGLVEISPTAAEADTTFTTNTQTNVNGSWQAGSLTASATNSDDVDATADSLSAAVIGASGTKMTTKVSHTAKTNVAGTVTTTGAQNYTAVNTVDHDVNLKGSGYGGASVNANSMENTLNYTAQVNLNEGTTLTGTGDKGTLTALAETTGDMKYTNNLKSAGVVAATSAYSKNDVTYANSISATNATLKTGKADQNITLAATDTTNGAFQTVADTQGGVVGAASAEAINNFHRSNTISLTGGLVESMNDVNLYAGADQNGLRSVLNYTALADAYNKTALPLVSSPSLENTMTQANQVLINGDVRSVRHTNLKAGQGLTTVSESAREYNNYTGDSGTGSTTSTALGSHTSSETTDNYVSLGDTGSVTAGIHTDLDLTISGQTKATKVDGKAALDWSGITSTVTKGSDWFSADSVKPSSVTLPNTLIDRYRKLANVIGQYAPTSNEYHVLEAEMKELKSLMETNGFVKNNGAILDEINVAAINLPDIVVSGGNITIDADKVTGTGSLKAQGVNAVNITNSSDLYLKTGDVIIKDKGGSLTFNDSLVGSSLSEFTGSLSSSAAAGAEPAITIKSTGTASSYASPDIGVFGDILNSSGDVTIQNSNQNIYIVGSANVTGKNIHIVADKGSVTQTSEGWLVVGSDPITRYQFSDSIAQKIQKYLSKGASNNWDVSWLTSQTTYDGYRSALITHAKDLELNGLEITKIVNWKPDESAGVHAGSNIYLTGKNVIVDGLVQSGYGTYKTVLTADDQKRINTLDSQWKRNRRALTDDQVMSNENYLINQGGPHYNRDTKQWEYEVKLYYNPATGKLLAENLAPSGGKIYITGAVASTNGSGRILAMDGTPDISIDTTAVAKDLTLHKIENNDIESLISIKDTNTNMLTEFTENNGSVKVSVTPITGKQVVNNTSTSNGITYYNPAPQTLKWTGGTAGDVKVTGYGYDKDFVMWGLIPYNTTEDFVTNKEVSQGMTTTSSQTQTGDQALAAGQVITKVDTATDKAYSVDTKVYTDPYTQWSGVSVDKDYDGFWGKVLGYGTVHYRWTGSQNSSTSSTYSIKADNPIQTGFITGGKDTISITANKNLNLAGNISSAGTSGTVTLNSNTGGITADGGASIFTDTLTASAAGNINLNHSALGTDATLSVKSTGGDVTVLSDKGNLSVKTSTAAGNLKLQADGNLTSASGTTLTGKRIDLISRTGAINATANAATKALSADTLSASLNADAAGDITLKNTNGNMRIGSIVSHNGNVNLTTSGSFEDATSGGTLSGSGDKLQLWQDMGIINTADTDDSKAKAAEAAKQERLDALTGQGNKLAAASKHTLDDYNAAADTYATAAKSDTDLQKAKTTYEDAVKAIKAYQYATEEDKQKALQKAYNTYDAARKRFLDSQGITGFTGEEQEYIISVGDIKSSNSYGWSKNDLLYALQSSVLNAPKGEVLTVAKANVQGKNITLNAAKNIGNDAEPVVINYADLTKLENLQLLSQAKAGDLTWSAADQTVTVRQQRPLTLQTTGSVTLQANTSNTTGAGSIYLAGVKDSALNVTGNISTTADVKLMADKGVTMESGGITAKNLIVTGGSGDIGSAAKNLNTNLSGTLDARTSGNLYLHQTGLDGNAAQVLTIQSVGGNLISLASDAGMQMTTEEGKNMGTIDGQNINLTSANGALGLSTDGLRIANSGGVLNASAATDGQGIYLAGIGSGSLVLNQVTAGGDLSIDSKGSIQLGQEAVEATDTTAAVDAIDSTVKADNITLTAAGFINLAQGELQAGAYDAAGKLLANTGSVNLNSSGVITQTSNHGILANTMNLVAAAGINMPSNVQGEAEDSRINALDTINITNTDKTKDVYVENKNNKNVTVNFAEGSTGTNVNINNHADDKQTSNLTVTGNGNAVQDMVINNASGNVHAEGTLTAGRNLSITAATSITNDKAVTATSGAISLTAQNGITQTGAITAGTSLTVASETEGNLTFTGNIESGTAASLKAKKGTIAIGTALVANNLTAGTTAAINSEAGPITIYGNTHSVTGTTLQTCTSGDLSVKGNLDATGAGNVNLITTTGKISVTGNIKAGQAVNVRTTSGSIGITGSVTSDAPVKTTEKTEATETTPKKAKRLLLGEANETLPTTGIHIDSTSGTITAAGDFTGGTSGEAKLITQSGDIIYSGTLSTGQAVLFQTQTGDITVGTDETDSSLTSTASTVTLETTGNTTADKGDITLYGTAASVTGTTVKTNSLGNIKIEGSLKTVAPAEGTELAKGTTQNVTVQTSTGNITLDSTSTTTPAISSLGDAVVQTTTSGGITVTGDITAGKAATLSATEGNVNLKGKLTASGGAANISASDTDVDDEDDQKGDITLTGDITSTTDAASISTNNGAINLQGNASAAKALEIKATNNGSITVGKATEKDGTKHDYTLSGATAAISTNTGAIDLYGLTKSVLGTTVQTGTGDINVHGSLQTVKPAAGTELAEGATQNVTVQAGTGNIDLTATLTDTPVISSLGDSVVQTTTSGGLTLTGDVTAGKLATLKAVEGNVNLTGDFTANGGTATISASDKDVDKVDAADDLKGDITLTGDITSATDAASISTNNGAINLQGNASAAKALEIKTTNTGNILVGQAAEKDGTKHEFTLSGDTATISTNTGAIDLFGLTQSVLGTTVQTGTGDINVHGSLQTVKPAAGTKLEAGSTQNVNVLTDNGDISLTATLDDTPVISSQTNAYVAANQTGDAKKAGDITITGDVKAAQSASLVANEGSIKLTGNLTGAADDAIIHAHDSKSLTDEGNIVVDGSVTAGDLLNLNTDNGTITAGTAEKHTLLRASNTASVTTDNGTITLTGSVESPHGTTVETTTTGDITITGDVKTWNLGDKTITGTGDVRIATNSGAISQTGDILSSDDLTVQTVTGNINHKGLVTAAAAADVQTTTGDILQIGNVQSGTTTDLQSLTKGQVEVYGNINSGTAATLYAKDGSITVGKQGAVNTITAGTTAAIATGTGDINRYGNTQSQTGTTVQAGTKGNILVVGDLTADKNNVQVDTKSGSIDLTGDAIAKTNDILVQSENGAIKMTGDLTAGINVTADTTNGSIDLTGDIQSGAATLLQATSGSISQTGQKIMAGTSLTAAASEGSIRLDSDISSQNGDTTLTASDSGVEAQKGNILVTGTTQALKGNVKATTDNGNIEFQNTVKADQNLQTRSDNGNLHFQSDIWSGSSISGETTSQGNLILDGTAEAVENIQLKADQNGSIILRKDLTSGLDTSFGTNNGDILFAGPTDGTAEQIRVTSKQGNIAMTTTGTGDIKDSHREAGGDQALVSADTGNITIRQDGTDDVDLQFLYALKDAGVEVKDGSLYLDTIDGNLVAVFVRSGAEVMDVKHMTAGTQIAVAGADIGLENVSQRVGSDGFLSIQPDGASADAPIEKLTIGQLSTNTGARFDHLWVRNGSITATQGELHLDKLYVLDHGYFSNGVMDTEVYGTTPLPNEATRSSYWNNTKLNDPRSQLTAWMDDSNPIGRDGAWKYLLFNDRGYRQYSNGNLLELDPHYYVYKERYSLNNWMRTQHAAKFMNSWQQAFHPGLTYMERYNLVDYTQAVPVQAGENAETEDF